jgi:dolichol-phosphate mannosyltransferase
MNARIAVVIPSYKVISHIADVIAALPAMVWRIYVVDDACPEGTGEWVRINIKSDRVRILRHQKNQGVGGAVITGYQAAIADGADVIVKIDGDGQMDPYLIPYFVKPILSGDADYTKGNRFFDVEKVKSMPLIRLLGNAALSLMTKLSSGYWNLFDPTNGYTAIHAEVAKILPFEKISKRYFFETDMLFRLNTLRAVVVEIPMEARYGNEISNLKISKIIFEFLVKHTVNFFKRVFYNYYLRSMSLASIELPVGVFLISFAIVLGCDDWRALTSVYYGSESVSISTSMLISLLSLIGGMQFLLQFFAYDFSSIPSKSLHTRIGKVCISQPHAG